MRPEAIRGTRRGLLAAFLVLTLAGADAHAVDRTPQQEIETRLMCYCGCANLTVRVCTCGTAEAIRAEIASRLASGETPDAVVAAYVARHGEKILSAPTKSRFNLLAWVMPFLALFAAGAVLVLLVRRWGRARSATAMRTGPDADAPTGPRAPDRALLERVRKEIEAGR